MSTADFDVRAQPYDTTHHSHPHDAPPSLTATITIVLLAFFFASFFSVYLCRFFMGYLVHLSNLRLAHSGNATVEPNPSPAVNNGLDPSIIDTFPKLVYSSVKDTQKDNKLVVECAVCLSEFEDSDELRLLVICDHVFHIECIDQWFENHTTCPICRRSLLPPMEDDNEDTETSEPQPSQPDQNQDHHQQQMITEIATRQNSVPTSGEDEEGRENEVVLVVGEGGNSHQDDGATASLDGSGQHGRTELGVERFSRCHSTGHSIIHVDEPDDYNWHPPELPVHCHHRNKTGTSTTYGEFHSHTPFCRFPKPNLAQMSCNNATRV